MAKNGGGKGGGGSSHDRAIARAKVEQPNSMPPPPSKPAEKRLPESQDHWTFGDTFAVGAFAVSVICWALIPNVRQRSNSGVDEFA
jgi:hypothetical protein